MLPSVMTEHGVCMIAMAYTDPRMGNEVLKMNQQEIQNLHFLFSCTHVKEVLQSNTLGMHC